MNAHDCLVCHGPELNGGDFADPTVKKISPNLMPWKEFDTFYDDEMNAIWMYLQSLRKLPQYTG